MHTSSNLSMSATTKASDTILEIIKNGSPEKDSIFAVLNNIVHAFPGGAHVKDSRYSRYLLVNSQTSNVYGFQSEKQMLGKDLLFIADRMNKRWNKQFVNHILSNEKEILNTKNIHSEFEQPYLDFYNNLIIHQLTKIPILDTTHQPMAILTLAINMTNTKKPQELYLIYKNLCNHKHEAIELFLNHIGLTKFLSTHNKYQQKITERELDCLMLLAQGKTFKEAAKRLNLSSRTVETHLTNVKNKFSYSSTNKLLDDFSNYYF